MATMMWWGNSEGIQGRCDAKCHDALKPECDCMCNGRYHGASHQPGGVEKVAREAGAEILEAAKMRAKAEDLELMMWPAQLRLL